MQAPAFDALLAGFVLAQEVQRAMTQDHTIGGGVALPQTAGTFSERDIQVPVQVVFNPPVAADGSQDLGCK